MMLSAYFRHQLLRCSTVSNWCPNVLPCDDDWKGRRHPLEDCGFLADPETSSRKEVAVGNFKAYFRPSYIGEAVC